MKASNVAEYLEHIKQITYSKNRTCWYRGHANAAWDLKPSVWRDYDREAERGMNHEFLWKARTRTSNPPADRDWAAWLALMQHFGLPTRLLDWSKSPLVALYFAVEPYYKHRQAAASAVQSPDATVWVLYPGELNIVSGLDPYIFSIYNLTAREMIEPAFVNPKTVKETNKIIAVSAVENELRMLTQQSAFTIHSSQVSLDKYKYSKKFLHRIDLPGHALSNIAEELHLLGYRPSQLFPDLEHLSRELKNRYSNIQKIKQQQPRSGKKTGR